MDVAALAAGACDVYGPTHSTQLNPGDRRPDT
jgi:hypothetical protein